MWIQLAIALIGWLGPILLKAFQSWLESRLKAKAAQFEAAPHLSGLVGTVWTETDGQVRLLESVRDDLWFWQIGKRRAVEQCINVVKTGNHPAGTLIGA